MSVAETNIVPSREASLPVPNAAVKVREGRRSDVAFMDGLQREQTKAVGWMPTKQLEGKIEAGHVLIAEDFGGKAVGYLIGCDRYFKRDDVGIIYQVNVAPVRQRGLIGATLLKAQFERSAYGCRLYCCWCAQDLPANRFWEAMGFVPLAVRAGGAGKAKGGRRKAETQSPERAGRSGSAVSALSLPPSALPSPRVHIFWQKRIVRGDAHPWWFPSKTDGGAMRADRLAIPIPPGTHWSEAKPFVVEEPEVKAHPKPRAKRVAKAKTTKLDTPSNGLTFAIPKPGGRPSGATASLQCSDRTPQGCGGTERKKPKLDPKHLAAARELRDRYLEEVNRPEHAHLLAGRPRYAVAKALPAVKRLQLAA